ncbi:stage III sporulation protein AB [uncultured Oscillibacter sp.]|uniref:stage III sporulation protein AB n=1 Tax=uncultured Oscillibacter sp. TaxID=876091 RepID=UPI0025D798DA|nr:stage III sporulation protein AB [uncultured Oscillibacter sp.]
MKLLGAALVLAGFGAAWRSQLRAWRQEEETLACLAAALEQLCARIRLTRRPLPRLLREVSGGGRSPAETCLRETAAAMERGEPPSRAWAAACRTLPLGETARSAAAELGGALSGGEEDICKAIQLAADRLRGELTELRHEKRDRAKRSGAVCFSAAALVIILLL